MFGRSLPREAAEHGADGHADAGEITLAQYVAGHAAAGGKHVARRLPAFEHDARLLVHLDAEIGEGDAGPQRFGVVWWFVDALRPVRFRDGEAGGRAVVEHGVVE